MPTTTTNLALPKPLQTDRVRDGWDAIADLADALDAYLAGRADKFWQATADENRASTTTYNQDAYFNALAIPANTKWRADYFGDYSCPSTAVDFRLYWSLTGGAAMTNRWVVGPATTSTDESDTNVTNGTRGFGSPVGYGATPAGIAVRESFVVSTIGAAAGTLTLVWAPIVSSASAVTRKTGSWLHLTRVA